MDAIPTALPATPPSPTNGPAAAGAITAAGFDRLLEGLVAPPATAAAPAPSSDPAPDGLPETATALAASAEMVPASLGKSIKGATVAAIARTHPEPAETTPEVPAPAPAPGLDGPRSDKLLPPTPASSALPARKDPEAVPGDDEGEPPAGTPPTTTTPGPPAMSVGPAPGLAERGRFPTPAAAAVEHRSARAAERVGGPAPAPAPAPSEAATADPGTPAAPDISGDAVPLSAASSAPSSASTAPLTGGPALPVGPALRTGHDAPPPPPAPVPHASSLRFAEEVGIAVAHKASFAGKPEDVVVRIEPADLGRIHVHLRFDEKGGIEALVSADQPRVLEQLRQAGADLHRALHDQAPRDVTSVRFEARADVQTGLASGGGGQSGTLAGGGQQQQSQQQQQARAASAAFAEQLVPDDAPLEFVRLRASGGRVDLVA